MKNSQIRGIVFDFDGTLADTIVDLANAINEGVALFGVAPHPPERIAGFVGEGIETTIVRALNGDAQHLPGAFEVFNRHYGEHFGDNTEVYPGVLEFLSGYPEIRKSVVSNKRQDVVIEMLKAEGMFHYVDPVVGARDGWVPKPAPDVMFDILKRWKMRPDEVAVVGDSWMDLQFARNAGTRAIFCTYGYGETRGEPYDAAISVFSELEGCLGLVRDA